VAEPPHGGGLTNPFGQIWGWLNHPHPLAGLWWPTSPLFFLSPYFITFFFSFLYFIFFIMVDIFHGGFWQNFQWKLGVFVIYLSKKKKKKFLSFLLATRSNLQIGVTQGLILHLSHNFIIPYD
jgi:hypothetical protein